MSRSLGRKENSLMKLTRERKNQRRRKLTTPGTPINKLLMRGMIRPRAKTSLSVASVGEVRAVNHPRPFQLSNHKMTLSYHSPCKVVIRPGFRVGHHHPVLIQSSCLRLGLGCQCSHQWPKTQHHRLSSIHNTMALSTTPNTLVDHLSNRCNPI